MALASDRVLAIGALISINTLRLFVKQETPVQSLVEYMGLNKGSGEGTMLYKGVGVFTVAQIMMAVNGMERLDKPGCKHITNDRLRSVYYIGAIVTAFLLPEFIYHSTKPTAAKLAKLGPSTIARVGLAVVLFSSALATMRSGWHLRKPKCNDNPSVWKTWFGEGIVAMAFAGFYGFSIYQDQ